jgi:hypothetical protein
VSDINFASTYTNKTLSAFTSIPPKAAIGLSLLLGGVVLSDLLNLEYFEFSVVRLGLDHILYHFIQFACHASQAPKSAKNFAYVTGH